MAVFVLQVLLLMASALNVGMPSTLPINTQESLETQLRTRQQRIAEITEMIHVSSLLSYNPNVFLRHILQAVY